MAVRAYATNSYPALSGEHHATLNAFQDKLSDFLIQYERFPEEGHTLIWPEFANPAKLVNQGTWEKFGELRTFLTEWAAHIGTAPLIDKAFEEFLDRPRRQRQGLPLPAGFVLDRARVASLPVPSNEARRRSSRPEGRLTGGGRRSGRHQIDSYRPSSRPSPRHTSGSSRTHGRRREDRKRVARSESSTRSAER